MAATSKTTTNHQAIRQWVEARHGQPATVKGTGKRQAAGLLRIDFPGYRGKQSLKAISWDEFFEKFDDKHLAFLYQDKTATGRPSRFCKFIDRNQGRSRARH